MAETEAATVFTVLPLQWRRVPIPDREWWTTDTIFGSLDVEDDHGEITWRYCFDEYYDEGREHAESVPAAKATAEAFYRKRLEPALQAVPLMGDAACYALADYLETKGEQQAAQLIRAAFCGG